MRLTVVFPSCTAVGHMHWSVADMAHTDWKMMHAAFVDIMFWPYVEHVTEMF